MELEEFLKEEALWRARYEVSNFHPFFLRFKDLTDEFFEEHIRTEKGVSVKVVARTAFEEMDRDGELWMELEFEITKGEEKVIDKITLSWNNILLFNKTPYSFNKKGFGDYIKVVDLRFNIDDIFKYWDTLELLRKKEFFKDKCIFEEAINKESSRGRFVDFMRNLEKQKEIEE